MSFSSFLLFLLSVFWLCVLCIDHTLCGDVPFFVCVAYFLNIPSFRSALMLFLTHPHYPSSFLSCITLHTAVSAHKTKGDVVRDVHSLVDNSETDLDGSVSTKDMENALESVSTLYDSNKSDRLPLDSTLFYRGYSHDSVEGFWKGSAVGDKGSLDPKLFFQASTKFISCLTEKEFYELYNQVEWVVLKKDHVLFEAGDPGDDGMFVVVDGVIGVFNSIDDQIIPVSFFFFFFFCFNF